MRAFFYTPTQVKAKVIPCRSEEEDNPWIYGIAYHDVIICACCGGVFQMDEVCEIIKMPWVDFTEEIGE